LKLLALFTSLLVIPWLAMAFLPLLAMLALT